MSLFQQKRNSRAQFYYLKNSPNFQVDFWYLITVAESHKNAWKFPWIEKWGSKFFRIKVTLDATTSHSKNFTSLYITNDTLRQKLDYANILPMSPTRYNKKLGNLSLSR